MPQPSASSPSVARRFARPGLDFDDTREDAIVHTGCVAVTIALAVGEAVEASGRAALEAMIAGVELDYPRHFIGHGAVRLTDGRRIEERQDHPRGGPDFPMTREELTAKFRAKRGGGRPGGAGRPGDGPRGRAGHPAPRRRLDGRPHRLEEPP